MKSINKILSLILCVAIIMSVGTAVLAEENNENQKKIPVFVNGEEVVWAEDDALPFAENGTTYVPLRKIAEALKAEVLWVDNTKTVYYFRNGKSVEFKLNTNTMSVRDFEYRDGGFVYTSETKTENVAIKIVNNRTMVPLRILAEAFGADKDKMWDAENYSAKVIIEDGYTGSEIDSEAVFYIDVLKILPKYDLKPVITTAPVSVKMVANFEGAPAGVANGVVVKLGDKTATIENDVCTFADVTAGEYTLEFEVPEGYELTDENARKVTVNVGAENAATIYLKKAEKKEVEPVVNGTVKVNVAIDEEGAAAVNGVIVKLGDKNATVENGICAFADIVAGTYALEIDAATIPEGYKLAEEKYEATVEGGKEAVVEIKLVKAEAETPAK